MAKNIETNSMKAWLLAARPKTLTGAAVPVMLGTALALKDAGGQIRLVPTVLCFLFAFLMQVDANFVNDYYDFVRGNDDETRLGPARACAMGWTTLAAMKVAIVLTTGAACLVGLPLVLFGGWQMVIVGAACVLFCFLYTTTLSYLGLGDLLVLLFFGLVPVCLTYYLAMPSELPGFTWEVLVTSLACGLVIDDLLIINNFRDIDNDLRAGKKTLIVRLGRERGLYLYLTVGLVAWLTSAIYLFEGHPFAFVLPLVYVVLHVKTYQEMRKIYQGKELNRILGKTARNMFLYGLLTSLGLLI